MLLLGFAGHRLHWAIPSPHLLLLHSLLILQVGGRLLLHVGRGGGRLLLLKLACRFALDALLPLNVQFVLVKFFVLLLAHENELSTAAMCSQMVSPIF